MRMPLLRRRPWFVAPFVLLALGACSDPFEVSAQFPTDEAVVTVHALNGTAPELSAALLIGPSPQAVRPGPDFFFDLAFDLDGSGQALLYPVDVVARPGAAGNRAVGLQLLPSRTYDEVTRAPAGGFTYQQPLAVRVGDVGVIQANGHPICLSSFLSTTIWAKFRVEAIDPAARTIRLRVRVDPNCGFRGLETGTPSR